MVGAKKAALNAHAVLVLFGDTVKHSMVSQGWTRTGLAVATDIPRKTIDALLEGTLEDLDLKSIARIAHELGLKMTVSTILEGSHGR